jgi:hypothetical protein
MLDAYTLEEGRRAYHNADAKGRIRFLKALYRGRGRGEGRAPFEIALLAVEDPHVEVRQWIARYGRYLDYHEEQEPEKDLVQRLKQDPDPFVRACLRENPTAFGSGIWLTDRWMDAFHEATAMERLALVRNPQVGEEFIEKIFDPEDQDLAITLEERQALVFAFLTNTATLSRAAQAALQRPTGADWIELDAAILTHRFSREFLRKLWELAAKWPQETYVQSTVYTVVPAEDSTKAAIYKSCGEPVLRSIILEHCSQADRDTLALALQDTDASCRSWAESIKQRTGTPLAPDDPEELFETEGFLDQKVNFFGKRLLDIESQVTTALKGLRNAIIVCALIYLVWQVLARFFR